MLYDLTYLATNAEIRSYIELNTFCELTPTVGHTGWEHLSDVDFRYTPQPDIYMDLLSLDGAVPGEYYRVSATVELFTGGSGRTMNVRFGTSSANIYTISEIDVGNTFTAYGYAPEGISTLDFMAYNTATTEFIMRDVLIETIIPGEETL